MPDETPKPAKAPKADAPAAPPAPKADPAVAAVVLAGLVQSHPSEVWIDAGRAKLVALAKKLAIELGQ